ncbi:Two component transcriptional regulator, LuxR family OS=Tsukamurella paurometabola (strain ATCC 8368/ DSM / CCUG 35730 / CIP 100753 / JCM 10117 / KCTC 9821 / NBRC 16120 / NCIMB 702349 / NCTC 13040) OX=521096 GN=Tpau_4145 PE=4 SV=1 [Tsukamurella paurometabola]|uniref:Two component transcriptional regulator, LuxR family n=1 Tax=Tsukamurella paurometabola (strain ATCC 8368 / DSM 20162 / CCUG 35730 / CIP 100753 / JCM 10117 / KCTC 9821 / NBRC 16120 / NCIMB 702349 / NCTC 13040) TaxID=521096 RepID=D5UP05_TSUPD|nr:response regulator transcription factor [Tsukamurella paurometabola]ADG80714.1 two component transcriptional regulator, LuxR family [Tsukamurella paurometabola DSM 20162]SUP40674.1 Transcriptional regulatory protein devR (dosR) [Tsukamurella paurometabola]
MATVFLVDDHEIVRRGLADLLTSDGRHRVVGEAATVREALARIPAVAPQVAVVDVRLPDGSGIDLIRTLRDQHPRLPCLVLTSYSDDEALLDAITAGAQGYVLKQIRGTELVSAIATVAAGGSLLDSASTARVLQRIRDADRVPSLAQAGLTGQEEAVLELLGEGLTNKQIAERMFLAEKTVRNHVTGVLAKLGVENRVQAALRAVQWREARRTRP